MAILQVGVTKSGNLWTWRIIQELLRLGDQPVRSFIVEHPIQEIAQTWKLSFQGQADVDMMEINVRGCYYHIASIFQMPIEDIRSYVARTSHVWSESSMCDLSYDILPHFEKIIYIIRDPRDVLVSYSKYAFTDYMRAYFRQASANLASPEEFLEKQLDWLMKRWVNHVGGFSIYDGDIFYLFFENLLQDFAGEVRKLALHLGIEIKDEDIAEIENKTSFQSMKGRDPIHVRRGKYGSWITGLSVDQKRRVLDIAGPLMSILNYPTELALSFDKVPLPGMPSGNVSEMVKDAMTYAVKG